MNIEINLTPQSRLPLPSNTPKEIRQLKSVFITYADDTTFLLEIDEGTAFHRINDYVINGKGLLTHEIFIAIGEELELTG